MGPEGTELILAVEEAFGVEIPDKLSREIRTVGELHEQVVKAIEAGDGSSRLDAHCFFRLRRALHAEFGYQIEELRHDTPLARLIPRLERKKHWERLHQSVDLVLPDLRKPPSVHLASLLVLGAGILSIFVQQERAQIILPVSIVLAMVIGIITERLRNNFPAGIETIGALADRVRVLNKRYIMLGGSNAPEVMEKLRGLVAKRLGVKPEDVKPEARFVEDLGMDR